MFVVFDGIDGSGKETQIGLLTAFLRRKKIPFAVHNYPTKKAKDVWSHLSKKKTISERALFSIFVSDIKKEQRRIREEQRGKLFVIANRYLTSTLAYQGDAVPLEEGKNMTKGFMPPDLIILLDLPVSIAIKRKGRQKRLDRFEEDAKFMGRVRKRFLLLKKKHYLTKNWKAVDGRKGKEEIQKEIRKIIIPYLR
jgi:dTMP kinase